mgnify:CR=1 FL=1
MSLDSNRWVSTLPATNKSNSIKIYFLIAIMFVAGLIFGRQTIVKNYVNINLKKLILIVCFVSAVLVLGQAFIEF